MEQKIIGIKYLSIEKECFSTYDIGCTYLLVLMGRLILLWFISHRIIKKQL